MIKFRKEKVLLLHQLMAEATGGDVGVRDEALLESAIENIYATFDGFELYPSKEEKSGQAWILAYFKSRICRWK